MECCNGAHGLSLLQVVLVAAAALSVIRGAASAKSSSSSAATLSWSSELSITIDSGNGSAIVKGSALLSPDHKSWAFGVVVGTNTTSGNIPVAFGIFKAVDSIGPEPTWEWKPVSSSDIASATVSFSPGEELVLLVEWRNGTSSDSSIAWSSDTGGDAEAVALTNSGQLLLLDAQNKTIWQRPGVPDLASAPAPLSPCPANICLLPPPPSSSPPAPPSPPSRSVASDTTFPTSLVLLLLVPLLV